MDLFEIMDFFAFWKSIGISKLVRFFWYAFIFEFPRYVLMDIALLIAYKISGCLKKDEVKDARAALFSELPLVSVIIPGKNEGENIFKIVRSLREQTYNRLQIIVMDDGSDDNTPTICRNLRDNGLLDIYMRCNIRGGKASVSNLGLRFSKGKFVLLLDADTSFDRDAVENILIPFYTNSKIAAVGGNVRVRNNNDSVCASLQAIEYTKTIAVGRAVQSLLGIYRIVPGAFGAFRKDVLHKVGGWDIGPGLDGDLTVKIRKLGYMIHFEQKAVCFTNAPDTFGKLNRQRLRWYRSLVRFRIRKHGDIYMPNENFQFLNFLSFAENTFFNVVLDLKWIIYIADMLYNYPGYIKYIIPMNYIIYLVFNIIQFKVVILLSERWKEDLKMAIYLPLVPIYTGLYLRTLRTAAYIQEFFFKSSYKDRWNPWKVSRKAYIEKL